MFDLLMLMAHKQCCVIATPDKRRHRSDIAVFDMFTVIPGNTFDFFHYRSLKLFLLFRYNPVKGFFCQIRHHSADNNPNLGGNSGNSSADMKCLGGGKGRSYPAMDSASESLLRSVYHEPNMALSELLVKLGRALPDWLQKELTEDA